MTAHDRITQLRVKGMRAIEDVTLPLRGLTVLIGENGTGKSTLLEAIELLHRAALTGSFTTEVLSVHGITNLFRSGADELRLGIRIEGAGDGIDYSFEIRREQRDVFVREETLNTIRSGVADPPVLRRDASKATVANLDDTTSAPVAIDRGQLALPAFGAFARPEFARVLRALSAARVHVPFDVSPRWIDGQARPIRQPSVVGNAAELTRRGGNLANCFYALMNERPHDVWQRTFDKICGAIPDVTRIRMPAATSGQVELVFERRFGDALPASALSDGQLTYLAFVALTELGKDGSVLGFDEPETHLHPELLVRVVWLFEELAESCPVLLATHSDRLLDALSDPSQVVLCEQGATGALRLSTPDAAALQKWMKRYRGLGDLRGAGFLSHVMKPET